MQPELAYSLPPLEELLCSGGDTRIMLGRNGMNKYGCPPVPQPDTLSYSSSTASTISKTGYAAAAQLYDQLEQAARLEPASATYARELARIRDELIALCDLAEPGVDIIFSASGTDLHLVIAQLLGANDMPLLVVMLEASETGSGVPVALRGQHFSDCTALGDTVTVGEAIGENAIDVAVVASRLDNGDLRSSADIDAEVEMLVLNAVANGQQVLLSLTDISKTGLIIPSVACATSLKERFPVSVDILVDACQFRLSNATLHAYLEQGFLVVITGSKFVTGPAFSAALLVPQSLAPLLQDHTLSPALIQYCTRAEWPSTWAAQSTLPDLANYGLLLRWEAALAELRAFHALPENDVRLFVETFGAAVQQRLADDPAFEPLAIRDIDRSPMVQPASWDHLTTIFPFRIARLNKDAAAKLYTQLAEQHCQLGQPVNCGALRLCLDMRLIVDALSPQGRGGDAIIAEAMRVLDKTAALAKTIS